MRDTLVFDVKELRHEDFKVYETLVPGEALELAFDDAQFIRPIACTVQLHRQENDNFYVTADVSSAISVQCRRCLKTFEVEAATELGILFCLGEEPKDADFSDERYYDGDTLDLSEEVRQALVIEVPIWPLCAADCQGLCTQCGANLNEGTCDCEMTEELPAAAARNPFSVLAQMLPDTDAAPNKD